MSSLKTININRTVQNYNNEVMKSIEKSSILAEVAYTLGKLPTDLKMPETSIIGIFRVANIDEQNVEKSATQLWSEIRDEFTQYCARYAVVGMTSAIELYIQKLHFITILAEAIRKSRGTISGSEYKTIKKQCMENVTKVTVYTLIDIICRTLHIEKLD